MLPRAGNILKPYSKVYVYILEYAWAADSGQGGIGRDV